jgi:hypothetical protein
MGARTNSPYCHDLLTKKRLFIDRPPLEESDLLDGSGACWCRHTKDAVGADGEVVDPEDCQEGRSCWRRWGSPGPVADRRKQG